MITTNYETNQANNIAENAVFLSVTIRMPGNRKQVDSNRVQVDADKEMISVSKKLLESPEFDDVKSLAGEVRRYLGSKCLPGGFLKSGCYLLPVGLIEEVHDRLEQFSSEFDAKVESFLSMYSYRKEQAANRLGTLYDEENYPPEDLLRQQFSLATKLMAVSVPGSLAEIRADIFAEERAKAQRDWEQATEEIRNLMRESFRDLVSHMAERLEPTPDGKRKIFRDTLVGNLREFLQDFSFRNIVDDSELEQLVSQTRELLDGCTPESLRRGPSWYRQQVQTGMEHVKQRLDGMLAEAPGRMISLED